jgi:hypothetical protein
MSKEDISYSGILAIDPGIKASGVAVFNHNRLIYANVIRPMAVVKMVESIQEIADLTKEAWHKELGVDTFPEVLIVERPQVYQQRFQKGDPNDLIPLAIMAGVLWEKLKPKYVMFPLPKEWKGQVPKDVTFERTKIALDKRETEILSNDMQRVPKGLRHNGYDAIGLGLWGLQRLGRRT